MKKLALIAIAGAVLFYAYGSWPELAERFVPAKPEAAGARLGNPVRSIEQAPNALIDVQRAIGGGGGAAAGAARNAVKSQVGR
jgi:hypothetical protein